MESHKASNLFGSIGRWLDNAIKIVAKLDTSSGFNPKIVANKTGSLKARRAVFPSLLVPHPPGFGLSTLKPN